MTGANGFRGSRGFIDIRARRRSRHTYGRGTCVNSVRPTYLANLATEGSTPQAVSRPGTSRWDAIGSATPITQRRVHDRSGP
jgi:hypothetical protein